jgi:hypothetical protein
MQRATLHSRSAEYSSRLASTVAQARIEPMKEFFPFALFVGVVVVLPVAAKSAPLAPVKHAAPELTIPVAEGCGINRYRDSRGVCRRKYEFTRHRGKHVRRERTPVMPLACHARACRGHPRLAYSSTSETWMAGTSPVMTVESFVRNAYTLPVRPRESGDPEPKTRRSNAVKTR